MELTNIYFLQAKGGGPVKIGKANDCKSRLAGHQTSHWQDLKIILELKRCHLWMEKELHNHFKEFNIRGEWFKEDILYDVSELERVIVLISSAHRKIDDKKKDWLIWSDLSYKIKLYSDNADRRKRVQKEMTDKLRLAQLVDQSNINIDFFNKNFTDKEKIILLLQALRDQQGSPCKIVPIFMPMLA